MTRSVPEIVEAFRRGSFERSYLNINAKDLASILDSHAALVAALRDVTEWLEIWEVPFPHLPSSGLMEVIHKGKAALKTATGDQS